MIMSAKRKLDLNYRTMCWLHNMSPMATVENFMKVENFEVY